MLIAEKDRREAFQASVTRSHLFTFGTLDEVVADLRERFSELVDRCLELDALEASYRVQILRAEVVLERKGITSSSEVHKELVPKINQLQAQIDLLTEEVAKLGLLVQDYAAAAALALAVGQNEKGAAAVGNVEDYAIGAAVAVAAALATGQNEKRAAVFGYYDKVFDSNGYATAASSVSTQHEKTAVPVGITDAAEGSAAATRMTEKGPVSTEMQNAESEAENRKPQDGGGSGSV